MMEIKELWIYPVKSLPGISLPSSAFDEYGLLYDRQWMLLNEVGRFMTQRDYPQMTQLRVEVSELHLTFHLPTKEEILLPRKSFTASAEAGIWSDQVPVKMFTEDVEPLYRYFGCEVKVVEAEEGANRNPHHNQGKVRLADKFPLLLVNEASVRYLNETYGTSLTAGHFRPNIIVDTGTPFEEDHWELLSVNGESLTGEETCNRCMMINLDPLTGTWQRENLKKLGTFRKGEEGVRFGRLLSPLGKGRIAVGDRIKQTMIPLKEGKKEG